MNNETTPALTPEQVKAIVVQKTSSFKMQVLRFLSAIGLILAAIGSADLTGVVSILPEESAGWVVSVGLLAASAKQVVLWIGDLIDNGKQDNSFKLGLWICFLLVPIMCLAQASCVAGTDENGNWFMRPDERAVEAATGYLYHRADQKYGSKHSDVRAPSK